MIIVLMSFRNLVINMFRTVTLFYIQRVLVKLQERMQMFSSYVQRSFSEFAELPQAELQGFGEE